jgi:hypothetical protein
VLQDPFVLVPQHHREQLVVDDALDQLGDAVEERLQIENGCQLAADLVEQRQRRRLALEIPVQPGAVDGVGDVTRKKAEQALVVLGEGAGLAVLDVEHADVGALDDQRDGQLGTHVGGGVDIPGISEDVVHAHRPARLGGGADDPLPHSEAPVVENLLRQPGTEVKAQVLTEIVEQQDAEAVVSNVVLQAFGDPRENLVEVEGRGQLLGHLHEKRHGRGVADLEPVCGRIRAGPGHARLLRLDLLIVAHDGPPNPRVPRQPC